MTFRERSFGRGFWIALTANLVLGILAMVSAYGGLSVMAYYAPYNMSSQEFQSQATFGPAAERDGQQYRPFVLDLPDATIEGRYWTAARDNGRGPFGQVHLKPLAVVRHLAMAAILVTALVWMFYAAYVGIRRFARASTDQL